jgi:DNA-binding NtrC family response regulator
MTALIVEDDPEILDIISGYLEDLGMETEKVASAEEALDKSDKTSFDLYFIDIILPGMNGIELTKKIVSKNEKARVAVMTGGGEGVEIVNQILLDAAVDKGALHSLAKPFSFDDVKELVNHFSTL